jgi:hypothetical protein
MPRIEISSTAMLLLAMATVAAHGANPTPGCPPSETLRPGVERIGRCSVEIGEVDGETCKVKVEHKDGKIVYEEKGPAFALDRSSGDDFDSDGTRNIAIRALGKERAFAYRIVSCAPEPTPVVAFENDFPARFERTSRGRIVIVVPDDGFRSMPDLPRTDATGAFAPDVRLMLEEGKLVDVGPEFEAHYDRTILELHDLSPPTLRKFRDGRIEDDFERRAIGVRIIKIVGSYLNSGREKAAWKELERDWPPGDVERVKREITAARKRGTLRVAQRPADSGPKRIRTEKPKPAGATSEDH